MADDESSPEPRASRDQLVDEGNRLYGVYRDHVDRVVWVMREKHPHVLTANMRFEEETGFENKFGSNNLADALSHLGTLVENAADLSYEDQGRQVTLFEDHLRRSMMEAWEQMLDFQLGEIAEMNEEYLEKARPLQVAHKLAGAPTAKEIDQLRIQHKHLLEEGRQAKRDADWDSWQRGTDKLIQACASASALRQAVEQAIAAANAHQREVEREGREKRRDRRTILMWVIGLSVTGAIGGFGIASALDDDGDSGKQRTPPVQPQQPKRTP
ncbi:MAG: hypothetical protein WKF96_24250 [Solirubrobacteraceae bacterium]